ncbi:lipoprotein-releasing ABC transporter permease subunit [Methyloversatilis sp.]|uniref:lipoprotein-releasing ABC transporter permease subunit n=1 Tax=Methyloversatilis sp. TaxID=2569862 RepID=UPI002734390C|nr:lipoprotein-releasing ABC transporter permease subunit [Methyloversatilis sp.]MDP2868751.1 lipoprotein-releasing ABC transporter permease subunit [Methyloversatilis sp.]MDP3455363.1 lipoprotein-releasing ABC transporter permease subunit [Methyloversatilis sp.]MDP3579170.1 lipoprotein-releasing ABC transporter permease subunit [Methyloversatilis sp.]
MNYEILLGLRYVRAKRRNGFISFISLISTLGLALGIAALITVLSVMNGFQKELRTRILGVASHVQITGYDNELTDWQQVADRALQNKDVKAAAPYVSEQAMLSFDQTVRGAMVRGVLPAAEDGVADFSQHMRAGNLADLQPGGFGVVLGIELARALRVQVGEKVTLIAPQGLVTPAAVLPRLKQFTVVGVFEAGHFEYDASLALIHMQDAQTLYRMEDRVSGVRLKLGDLFDAPRVARDLHAQMSGDGLLVGDWTRQHANFFRAIAIEKNMMFIILMLIVAVAAFNIVSMLIMVVTDKQADIAILRTLGASPASMMAVFIVQGAIIGGGGLLLGVAGGVALASNLDIVVPAIEAIAGVSLWSAEVYFIPELPSEILWSDVLTVTVIGGLLTLAATLYPSWRASRVQPAEALRYE